MGGAGGWASSSRTPSAAWTTAEAPTNAAPNPSDQDGAITSPEWLESTRTVLSPRGSPLARIKVLFTLRPENEAFRANRVQLFWITSGVAAVTSFLLALLARRYVVAPLTRLPAPPLPPPPGVSSS